MHRTDDDQPRFLLAQHRHHLRQPRIVAITIEQHVHLRRLFGHVAVHHLQQTHLVAGTPNVVQLHDLAAHFRRRTKCFGEHVFLFRQRRAIQRAHLVQRGFKAGHGLAILAGTLHEMLIQTQLRIQPHRSHGTHR